MAGLTVEQDLRVRSALADLHDQCFTRDMKVTLVARHPTEAEQHLVCGDDDLVAVAKLVRSKIPPADRQATGEQLAKLYRIQMLNGDGKPEGTRDELERCAKMLDTYAPECFPADDQGRVDFSRAMMESVADVIRAFIATLPAEQPREGEVPK